MSENNEALTKAMDHFEIPAGNENFLFILPALYVAKSDGKISIKEAMSIAFNAAKLNLTPPQGSAAFKSFQEFLQTKIVLFSVKTNLEDLAILTEGINVLLAQYPDNEERQLRDCIRLLCEKVAQASGPLFREKILAEEQEILDKIFAEV